MTASVPMIAPSALPESPRAPWRTSARRIAGVLACVLGMLVGGPLGMIGTVAAVVAVLQAVGEVGFGGGLIAMTFVGTGLAGGSFAGWVIADGLVARPLVGRPIPLVRLATLGALVPASFAFLGPVLLVVLARVMGSVLR